MPSPSTPQAPQRRGAERRRSQRRDVTLGGKLFYGLCGLSVDCVIRDLSIHGARIAAPKAWKPPREVQLLSVREGRLYRGVVAWSRGRYLALDFTDTLDLAHAADPALEPMRAAWLAGKI